MAPVMATIQATLPTAAKSPPSPTIGWVGMALTASATPSRSAPVMPLPCCDMTPVAMPIIASNAA